MKKYDHIIIGFGKGGKTLAAELAKRGQQVAMIERSAKMYGGTCINTGCIPTKTLIHQAETAAFHPEFSKEDKKTFYRKAVAEKEKITSLLRQKNYNNLAGNPNITVYTGAATFVSPEEIEVSLPEGPLRLQAGQFYINTGAETIIPPIEGIKDNPRVYTSTGILELTELPDHLVIIGGGYIGLEFASMYASFGSTVTVLEGASELIPREDRDIVSAVKETLEKKGIGFRMNARVISISTRENRAKILYRDTVSGQTRETTADAVLLATGRQPATAGLGLDKAGVTTDERGTIVVDDRLITSQPHIRAIGDVKGGPQFTYISLDDYRIIREDLFGSRKRTLKDRVPVSYSVFIDPPLSRIGMSETEARQKGLNITVKKLPVTAISRALTLNNTNGLLKAIVNKENGNILGCTLFCPESTEMINTVAMALKTGQPYTFLRDFIFTHPSMSEALNELFDC